MRLRIPIDEERLAGFCKRNKIVKLAIFGSALRSDFRGDSDVDVLVEFAPGSTPGWEFFDMQTELSDIIGRNVDLNTAGDLSPHFRNEVVKEAEIQYVAA